MALVQGFAVTVNSATTSDHIKIPSRGDYILKVTSSGAFVVDIQEGGQDGDSFSDVYVDATSKATVDSSSGPQSYRVSGGLCYRMNATTYNNPITMVASSCGV
jgi:hypothetical protein